MQIAKKMWGNMQDIWDIMKKPNLWIMDIEGEEIQN
jgi:hypothetical protein